MKFKVGDKIKALPSSNKRYNTTCERYGWIGKVTAVLDDEVFEAKTIANYEHKRINHGITYRLLAEHFEKVEKQPKIETKHHAQILYDLYYFLKNHHVGKKNAISAKSLSWILSISERDLREIIHEIRESKELELCIGSCNKGYYICTEEDYENAIKRLYRQAFSTLKVARALEKKVGMNGQGKLKLGEYYAEFVKSLGE